eukprot:12813929-Alexandrium_andersonii.AAC.1
MSASLVGSEMCIRDRVSACRWRRRASCGASGATNCFFGREGGFPPVSYTHLTLPTICSV